MTVYIVEAHGTRENHSYVVGVWEDFDAAKKVADEHAAYRGGKYVCQVLQTPLNEPMATDWNETVLYETGSTR
jgi:hypothetical protein